MISSLKLQNSCSLEQLSSVIKNLTQDQFTNSFKGLSNSSIGMHVRHILEFYICLQTRTGDVVNYDERLRNGLLETIPEVALNMINDLIVWMNQIDESDLLAFASNDGNPGDTCNTSLTRELQYLSDHTVHHLAILKLIFVYELPHVVLPQYFGYAYSTIKHLENVHANLPSA
jgi:hypothetical protein